MALQAPRGPQALRVLRVLRAHWGNQAHRDLLENQDRRVQMVNQENEALKVSPVKMALMVHQVFPGNLVLLALLALPLALQDPQVPLVTRGDSKVTQVNLVHLEMMVPLVPRVS